MLQVLRILRETGSDAWYPLDKICHPCNFCATGLCDRQHACVAYHQREQHSLHSNTFVTANSKLRSRH